MSKISSLELCLISFFLMLFLLPGFGNTTFIDFANSSSIITSIVGFIIGIIPLLLIIYIRCNMESNIFNIFDNKIIRFIFNVLLIIFAIYLCFIGSFIISNFIISQYLTRDSYYVIALIICFITAYSANKGIEVISRTSIILFVIFIIMVIFSFIFLIPISQMENIYPIFNIDKLSFVKASLVYSSFVVIPLIFTLFIKNKQVTSKKLGIKTFITYVFCSIIAISFIYLIMSVFGINIATILSFPEYLLFRKIKAFGFIERVENIVSVTIFILFFVGFAMVLSFIRSGIKDTFSLKKDKTLNIAIYIINFIVPLISIYIFTNYKVQFIYEYFYYVTITVFIILIIMAIKLFIKKHINQ